MELLLDEARADGARDAERRPRRAPALTSTGSVSRRPGRSSTVRSSCDCHRRRFARPSRRSPPPADTGGGLNLLSELVSRIVASLPTRAPETSRLFQTNAGAPPRSGGRASPSPLYRVELAQGTGDVKERHCTGDASEREGGRWQDS
jgi:hypothetical protein